MPRIVQPTRAQQRGESRKRENTGKSQGVHKSPPEMGKPGHREGPLNPRTLEGDSRGQIYMLGSVKPPNGADLRAYVPEPGVAPPERLRSRKRA